MTLEALKKEFSKNFIIALLIIFSYYIFITFILKLVNPTFEYLIPFELLTFCFLLFCYLTYFVSKTKYNLLKINKLLLISLFLLIYLLAVIVMKKTNSLFLFYIPFSLLIMVVYSVKEAFICALLIMIVCFVTFTVATNLNIKPKLISTEEASILYFFNYSVVFFSSALSLFMIYYNNKFNIVSILNELQSRLATDKLEPSAK
jgi:hypothetical protein